MDTSKNSSPTLFDRIRSRRLATTFVLLATLSVGILAGSVLTRNVSGKEQSGIDSSDAKPLVIMITANQGARHKTFAQSLGVSEYLNKPVKMDRLVSTAEKLLSQPAA